MRAAPLEALLAERLRRLPRRRHTEQTANLMDAAAFAAMRRGAFFLNLSRGELVDEAALEAALDSGHLAGAAMDVGRAPDQMPTPRLGRAPEGDRHAACRRPDPGRRSSTRPWTRCGRWRRWPRGGCRTMR